MILAIGGATATGKTALSVRIAHLLGGEIVCADSMQIYKRMDIGTAKVTEEEKEGIPHHMVDIIEPNESFSAENFSSRAGVIIDDIEKRGKVPILVGGTGLYFSSLLYGYKHGAFDESLRKRLEEEKSNYGKEYMWHKLRTMDPIGAEKIHPNNEKRVLRAIEVFTLTGKSVANQNDTTPVRDFLLYAIDWDRETLYQRINARVDIMFEQGLEKEVKSLLESGTDFSCQSMQAIGYKEFQAYFDGEKSAEEVKDLIKQHTRNYAKRQITWFKGMKECVFLKGSIDETAERIKNEYLLRGK